jgi:hypothetical protein
MPVDLNTYIDNKYLKYEWSLPCDGMAGGRGVIDGIEKNLQLTPRHVEASRYALYTLVWSTIDKQKRIMN